MSDTVLQLRDIEKHYAGPSGKVGAVAGVSLSLSPRDFVAVQGPSGCGKSTLLLASGGLLAPDSGTVSVAGKDLYAMPTDERARFRAARIGFVFQQFHLIPYLDVLDNVLAPTMALPMADGRRKALGLIERFGLGHRLHHVPAALSTGERQRAALARALLHDPPLLLADEPTGNLDEANGDAVLAHLAEFAKAGGAVLLVTHDPKAARHATRTILMMDGRSLPDEVRQTPPREIRPSHM
ncbi:MAG: ABC transporter ATP-binding protein [Verrucomicrobiae bacterium]|nr:ABC transporter ATP-binding protein [Verrucomicrobiae bacterium]